MPAHLMAADLPVLHDPKARAGKTVLQMDHTGLQPGGRGDDLEGGARLIGIADTAVPPHPVPPVLGRGPPGRFLGRLQPGALADQVLV